ncbi:hypothetical protein [Granulicella mallensis]|uniref:hypothetical protein n=1 Tax=Granulicella mallensis TaxID=940614 RepID=UPI0005C6AA1B|nr:hypothetical protein [Granulicella mallensis]
MSLDLTEALSEFLPVLFDAVELLRFPERLPADLCDSSLPFVAEEPALWTAVEWRRRGVCVAAKAERVPAVKARTSSSAFARAEPLACAEHVRAARERCKFVIDRFS